MNNTTLSAFALAMVATACSSSPVAPTPSQPTSEPAPAAPAVQRSYTLSAPDTWKRSDHRTHETFVGPDGQLKLHVVEGEWSELAAGIAAGWKLVSPTMKLTERRRSEGAPESRFREQLVITYVDDAEESFAQGMAMRHKTRDTVYLFLVEGPLKEVRKRGAELSQVISSMEVEGAARLEVAAADVKPFDAARQKAFFDSVEALRKIVNVPGVAVGVVTPQGTFTRGFGTREMGGGAAVDADTQFMIGSVTKSFSTMLLATLVDDAKVKWESSAHETYASFRVADPKRTHAIQMQHLFCACTGAPRQDMELLFDFDGVTASDMFRSTSGIELTTAFGETFQYNNQLTAVGGYIAGHIAYPAEKDLGVAYQRALDARVLAPLGMKTSVLDPKSVVARGNFAVPHRLDWSGNNAKVSLAHERFALPVAPAGALWSTARDMTRYIQVQLGKGTIDGKRVVSAENLQRTQTQQIKTSDEDGYGMGWLVGKYRGLASVKHGGGTMGFNTLLTVFPEIGVGVFVVANRSPAAMNGRVRERLIEVLFDMEPRATDGLAKDFREMTRLMAESRAKVSDEPVPESLLGNYVSKRLGRAVLRKTAQGVELDVGEWTARVGVLRESEQPNTLVFMGGPLQGARLLIDGKNLVMKQSQTNYTFTPTR